MALLLSSSTKKEEKIDLASFYKGYGVNGSFALHDQKNDKDYFYNKNDYSIATTPASTFKICNSLIGLETGVISDENYVIPWTASNARCLNGQGQRLKNRIKNSTVRITGISRDVGVKKMKAY